MLGWLADQKGDLGEGQCPGGTWTLSDQPSWFTQNCGVSPGEGFSILKARQSLLLGQTGTGYLLTQIPKREPSRSHSQQEEPPEQWGAQKEPE